MSLLKRIYFSTVSKQAVRRKYRAIRDSLPENATVLDVGTGKGTIAHLLQEDGFQVTAVDIADRSFTERVKPKIYDGKGLPFETDSFDFSLLITVLHHTPNPFSILEEAARVGRRVIIIEDIYQTNFQKYATFAMDSLVNLEFRNHPHSNKSDQEWQETFSQLGLTLSKKQYWRALGYFQQVLYEVEKI